ncbi:MAG: CDP-alcohol phosphatidyltransferase family protein [Desulfomonile tiedjei]|nr:CDP-alcohol phosphatidyltransferase family protein [Desulfomonile tiedjei]
MSRENLSSSAWQTKPTDRFVLKWVKCHLSARITPRVTKITWLRPWMITVSSSVLGMAAGAVFSLGWGLFAGLLASISQILDGVDGQFARLTGQQSRGGAFLDSVLDRYSDGALVIGLTVFSLGLDVPSWLVGTLGALALIGSGNISYSSARAESLGIQFGRPTLASKGTRTTVTALSGLASPFVPIMPLVALCYLVLHTNIVVLYRIGRASGPQESV